MENKNNPLYLVILGVLVLSGFVAYVVYQKDISVGLMKSYAGGNQASVDSGSVWAALKAKGLQGEHYTLNIHGKNDSFNKQDCTVVPDPLTGEYSNNIFVPSYSSDAVKNQIIMTSGNAKGKWAATAPTYGVRDACTAPFDGDAAELVLPPNEKGYYVTSRVLGKPTDNPEITLDGSLMWVVDENGNDLLVLGLVTDNGFQTPSGTYSRTTGKVKAVDITGLFEWNGGVCYFSPENYCYDTAGQYTCTDRNVCCTDADGVYETCTDPTVALDGTESCTVGSLLPVSCQDYVNEWVFNIGDFVGYMWDTYTDGNFKLSNIRFYPVR
jgi:hypothetical protein